MVTTHSFRIQISTAPTDYQFDLLHEMMPDDVLVEGGPAGNFIGFEREGDLAQLILEAVSQIIDVGLRPIGMMDQTPSEQGQAMDRAPTIRAALIPEDDKGDPVIIELPTGHEQLAELQRRVGGNIELVRLPIGDLWINEEYLEGTFGPNSLATTFVQALSPRTRIGGGGILGPAVLTGPDDQYGQITDLQGFHHTEREPTALKENGP